MPPSALVPIVIVVIVALILLSLLLKYVPIGLMITAISAGVSGVVSQGGWASHIRTDAHWVFPIPEALDTNNAAPMLW